MNFKLLTFIVPALIFSLQTNAFADNVWTGTGQLYDTDLKPTDSYKLKVENIQTQNKTHSKITVTLTNSKSLEFVCDHTYNGAKWSSKCDSGTGGGFCIEDLCQTYTIDGTGLAHVTFMTFDGPDNMRLLRTELKNGVPTRIYKEKISRESK